MIRFPDRPVPARSDGAELGLLAAVLLLGAWRLPTALPRALDALDGLRLVMTAGLACLGQPAWGC